MHQNKPPIQYQRFFYRCHTK